MHELTKNGASFSPDRVFRYKLWRTLRSPEESGSFEKPLVVIGLNPSTADETEDDPTIRRLRGFAARDGFDKLIMLNLFAFRSTDPAAIKRAPDPVGPWNDDVILSSCMDRTVLCAWGTHGAFKGRGDKVARLLNGKAKLVTLGVTKEGFPKHPLYLANDTPMVEFKGAS